MTVPEELLRTYGDGDLKRALVRHLIWLLTGAVANRLSDVLDACDVLRDMGQDRIAQQVEQRVQRIVEELE